MADVSSAVTSPVVEHPEAVIDAPAPPAPRPRLGFFRRNLTPDLVRYLYFMRFSLFLWLSMPLLAFLDWYSPGIASLTRGILTPFNGWQWIVTGFIVVLPGWFALLAARIVCAYGHARFGSPPPPIFVVYNRMEALVFWGAQLPGLLLLLRIAANSHTEESLPYPVVAILLLTGAAAALIFWYLVAILYYWTYVPDPNNPAFAFLVPTWSKLHLDKIEKLEPTASIDLFRRTLGKLCRLGDGYTRPGGFVAPGHVVATIALLCAVFLYGVFMPISAPKALPILSRVVRVLAGLFAAYAVLDFLLPALRVLLREKAIPTSARLLPLLASCLLLAVLILGIVQPAAPRVIPVIGYVVILLVVLFWGLSGIAFFADRFRLPILTTVFALILLINLSPAEHVFPVQRIDDHSSDIQAPLPSPEEFVKKFALEDPANPRPVIIVTATGGGIHAADWTATALNQLDRQFGPTNFHNHILLLSTVSGGSVGTMGFLREYLAPQPFARPPYDRVQQAAGCSSLQAVAWGVAYPDTLRLLAPWFFNLFSSLSRYDRGWALETALERNLRDPECVPSPDDRAAPVPDPSGMTLNTMAKKFKSFDQLPPGDPYRHLPAFTFNTTVVETGDRFLLANYSAFAKPAGAPGPQKVRSALDELLPAGSFLGIYGRRPILPVDPAHPDDPPAEIADRGGYADLSLLTAARLSASFTYVSPATRLPFEYAQGKDGLFQRGKHNAFHFVDGGYYDNDGVNSAIEFLKTAFQPAAATATAKLRAPAQGKPSTSLAKLHILFIEIRNDADIDQTDSPDSYKHQAGYTDDMSAAEKPGQWLWWQCLKQVFDQGTLTCGPTKQRTGPLGQFAAPPLVALRSGFSSVTRRNRRELDTLKDALADRVDLDHIVLDYRAAEAEKEGKPDNPNSELDPPLSWHLTTRQRRWIEGSSPTPAPPQPARNNGWLDSLIAPSIPAPAYAESAVTRTSKGRTGNDYARIAEALDRFQQACRLSHLDQTCEPTRKP